VTLGLPFRGFTTDCGVDILSFGGTKNGMMYGEAVCFLRKGLSADFKYIRNRVCSLHQNEVYFCSIFSIFQDDLWKECASHANRMAGILADRISRLSEIKITQAVQANVFSLLCREMLQTG
jgi:threonine aldolase